MKKAGYLFLAALICFSFVSCGEEVIQTTDIDSGVTKPVSGEETLDIPLTYDYEGYEFNFLNTGNFDFYELGYDEESSIPIDNAQYKRKRAVEQNYNVDIIEHTEWGLSKGGGPGYKKVSAQVNSGDYTYDACMIAAYDTVVLAYSGYLYNINAIPTISLEKSWWDQNATESCSIRDVVFFTTGDFTISENKCATGLLFNKKLIADYNMESPYELVRNGDWTLEKFIGMIKQVSEDVNSDGDWDENDLYGLLAWDGTATYMVNAFGERSCTVNEDGDIELTLFSEKVINGLERFKEVFNNNQVSFRYSTIDANAFVPAWNGDHALFFPYRVLSAVLNSRNMTSDFGIIPMPKYDAQQENYYSGVAAYHLPFVCFPLIQADVERAGTIVEALSYYGQKHVLPALYDTTIVGQSTRDVDSEEMLTIIFDNIVYDVGYIYRIGPYADHVQSYTIEEKGSYAAMYDKYKMQASGMANVINAAYKRAVEEWQ